MLHHMPVEIFLYKKTKRAREVLHTKLSLGTNTSPPAGVAGCSIRRGALDKSPKVPSCGMLSRPRWQGARVVTPSRRWDETHGSDRSSELLCLSLSSPDAGRMPKEGARPRNQCNVTFRSGHQARSDLLVLARRPAERADESAHSALLLPIARVLVRPRRWCRRRRPRLSRGRDPVPIKEPVTGIQRSSGER